jgi:hypothetical protein
MPSFSLGLSKIEFYEGVVPFPLTGGTTAP